MKHPYLPRGNPDWSPDHESLATNEWMNDEVLIDKFSLDPDLKNPFIFGKKTDEQEKDVYLAYDDDAGIFTVASSRAGKNISLITPNLLHHKGSAIVLDIKGELSEITAEYRYKELGQNVAVFDPYGESNIPSSSLNPLLLFDPNDPEYIDDLSDFSDSFVLKGGDKDPHWDESARSVISMVNDYVIRDHPASRRNLYYVRKLILKGQSKNQSPNYRKPVFQYNENLSPEENEIERQEIEWEIENDKKPSFNQFLHNLAENENDIIAGTAQRLLQAGDRERGSILSTVQRNTEFLDSPCIEEFLCNNEFNLNDLRKSTVYLVLPERRLDRQSRWLRMMLTIMLRQLIKDWRQHKGDPSCLMILDEAASLGYMSVIERASAYVAGYGIKLWTIWQSLSQLQSVYGKGWETFISNASFFTAFGNNDYTTQEYISKRLGKCEAHRIELSYAQGTSENDNRASLGHKDASLLSIADAGGTSGSTTSKNLKPSKVVTPLLQPDEVGRYFGKSTEKSCSCSGKDTPFALTGSFINETSPLNKGLEKTRCMMINATACSKFSYL